MTLEQQLQLIIDDAANYGVPPILVRKAIAPVLKTFASQLQNLEYYVLQNLENEWVLTTIANSQLEEKRVIYAFTSVPDAANFQGKDNLDLIAMPISVVQLLFRLFSLQQVDSIIFFDEPRNFQRGVEIPREQLSQLIKQQLELLNKTPPDIA